jgi:hypothetical protein
MATIRRSTPTVDTLTDDTIEALRAEAVSFHDVKMVDICDMALLWGMECYADAAAVAKLEIVRVLLDADASAD